MPGWVKCVVDDWLKAANLTSGKLFRRVNRKKRRALNLRRRFIESLSSSRGGFCSKAAQHTDAGAPPLTAAKPSMRQLWRESASRKKAYDLCDVSGCWRSGSPTAGRNYKRYAAEHSGRGEDQAHAQMLTHQQDPAQSGDDGNA